MFPPLLYRALLLPFPQPSLHSLGLGLTPVWGVPRVSVDVLQQCKYR